MLLYIFKKLKSKSKTSIPMLGGCASLDKNTDMVHAAMTLRSETPSDTFVELREKVIETNGPYLCTDKTYLSLFEILSLTFSISGFAIRVIIFICHRLNKYKEIQENVEKELDSIVIVKNESMLGNSAGGEL